MKNNYEIGALILRMALGLTFFIHGLDKFQGGIANTAGWFDTIGLPSFLAYVVAVIELAGGLAMIAGLGTRYISILFAFVMLGAIAKVKLSAGFVGGYELDFVMLAMSVYLALNGSKLIAADQLLARSFQKQTAKKTA